MTTAIAQEPIPCPNYVQFDDTSFVEQIQQPDAQYVPLFKQQLNRCTQLIDDHHQSRDAILLVKDKTALIDNLLWHAWHRFFSADDKNIALLPVGGYGRGELFPYSDIDILILLRKKQYKNYQEGIEQFITLLWDMGLEVGQSVRTMSDCRDAAKGDITIATNLLEGRLLVGPEDLWQTLKEKTSRHSMWPSDKFFEAKLKELNARYDRFHGTSFNLEPNIKESPGGLRDLQMIGWVGKRHFGGDRLRDLVKTQFLTKQEYQAISECRQQLFKVRYALHLIAGREEDRLLLDQQQKLAVYFGFKDSEDRLAVEQFMQQYYRTVGELREIMDMLLNLFQESIIYAKKRIKTVPINDRFQIIKQHTAEFLDVTDPHVFEKDPAALIEIFWLFSKHPDLTGISAQTIRLIRASRHLIDDQVRASDRAKLYFMAILKESEDAGRFIEKMHRYGVLSAYLPIFSRIVGRKQYDMFHAYTVDAHILFVVGNISRVFFAEHSERFPLCNRLVQAIPKIEVLYVAALFHDIAKGRGGDHSNLGTVDAEEFCHTHNLSDYDTRLVSWLVKQHLVMSTTSQKKDISNPNVIQEFARTVQTRSRLDHLFLLTVADINGTNPSLWNSWRGSLLRQLYEATRWVLNRGIYEPVDEADLVDSMKLPALKQLCDEGIDEQIISALWDTLPVGYFIQNSLDWTVNHTRYVLQNYEPGQPLVWVHELSLLGGTEVFFYLPDRDNLFAHLSTLLSGLNLSIADARILTSTDKLAMCSFRVIAENDRCELGASECESLTEKVIRYLDVDFSELPKASRIPNRQLKNFEVAIDITFRNDRHYNQTIMDLTTLDRPKVLQLLGETFITHQVRTHHAKISTLGERTENVFFITDLDNEPLSKDKKSALRNDIKKKLTQEEMA